MIRGHLKLIVLKLLIGRPMNGYELMKEIGKQIGSKPSSGSIYPLLDSLHSEGLVSVEESERQKIYTITASGKGYLKDMDERRALLVSKLSEGVSVLESVCDIKQSSFFSTVFRELKEGRFPFEHLEPEISEFRDSLKIYIDPKHKNAKKVKKMLKEFTRRIKELK